MIKRFPCLALLCAAMTGCVQVPKPGLEVSGDVRFAQPLPRPAVVTVELFGQQAGQSVSLAQQSYRVSLLPLAYSFTLPPTQDVDGLVLRARLAWQAEGADQAAARAVVVPGAPTRLVLQARSCFPRCAVGSHKDPASTDRR
ncbi:YscW family type III secretion system pilotin [Pseudomonas sp. MWU13-3659]|uniref:YscW family type III secretion system pilotin n=1 Tax=Pseudomonas sp. MWU13-3659 TaxID=2986964 RepID=UPI002074B56B|nr:YscW family type III secretion system pilotin [Pseudomonas sp. MWU13-3659]